MSKVNGELEEKLIEVINQFKNDNGLHPQVAATTLNKICIDVLEFVSWKPQELQCADIYLKEAQNWLLDGIGTPVLCHGSEGGDKEVLSSLVAKV